MNGSKKKAIVILGGGITEDTGPTTEAKRRIDAGLEIFFRKQAEIIIMSGKYSGKNILQPPITEAKSMKRYAISKNIPSSRIIKEEKSKDTCGNAYYSEKILRSKGIREVIVITSSYHLARTKFIFNKFLGNRYNLEFRGTKIQVTKEVVQSEKKKLKQYQKWLKTIPSGNIKKLQHLLLTEHFFYAKNPQLAQKRVKHIFEKT